MHALPPYDPGLPHLQAALDAGGASERFGKLVTAAGRPFALGALERADTKYQPGSFCVVAYRLYEQLGDGEPTTIGVVEVDGSGVVYRLFDDDPQMPALASAADAEVMRARFAGLFSARVEACRVTPARYKPGVSCVLRYALRSPSGTRTFYGKLLHGHGAELSTTLRALASAGEAAEAAGAPLAPLVVAPTAYWDDLELVVQRPAGSPLSLGRSHASAMRDAGDALAWLHGETVPGPPRALEDDVAELSAYRPLFARLAPELLVDYERVAAAISRAAEGAEPPPVASHGALRVDQFLSDDGRLALIDLDAFCWSNPARDPANLLAYLDWKAIRRPDLAADVDEARTAFMDGYASARAAPDERWLRLYRAASMLKIAGRRFRSLDFDEWALVPRLLVAAKAAARA